MYLELPMEGTLEFPAVVRTDGLDFKHSKDDFVGKMFLQHSRRVANGILEHGHLRTSYSRPQ